MNEWISVKDQWPPINQEVLTFSSNYRGIEINRRLDEEYPDDPDLCNRIVWYDQGIFNEVTHWMPLPKPPCIE